MTPKDIELLLTDSLIFELGEAGMPEVRNYTVKRNSST